MSCWFVVLLVACVVGANDLWDDKGIILPVPPLQQDQLGCHYWLRKQPSLPEENKQKAKPNGNKQKKTKPQPVAPLAEGYLNKTVLPTT